MIFYLCGTVNYSEVFKLIPTIVDKNLLFLGFNIDAIDLICLLLFVGAMGKSAQILLHTWLPDAMEGPTPVSALIHAATMVTAGVFLVVRCSPIYEYSELALNVITIVGMSTAFFAATVKINKVKTCPDRSFKYIENETKFILTANKISSILIKITIIFFLFKKIPTIPIVKITAPKVR